MTEPERKFIRKPEPQVETPTTSTVAESRGPSMDEAADLLCSFLPADVRERLDEQGTYHSKPRWQVLLGIVIRVVVDRPDLLAVPYFLGTWSEAVRPHDARPCKTCGTPFVSRYPDAQYCCDVCYFGKLGEKPHAETCYITVGVNG